MMRTLSEIFWNPIKSTTAPYIIDDIVLYNNQYYISMIDDNFYCPNKNNYDKFKPIDSLYKYWKPIEEPTTTKWKKIEILESK